MKVRYLRPIILTSALAFLASDTFAQSADEDELALVSARTGNHWDFGLMIRNLFNANAREPTTATIPNDLPMAPRSIYI